LAPFLIPAIRSPAQFNRLAELQVINGEPLTAFATAYHCRQTYGAPLATRADMDIAAAAITRALGTEPPLSHLQVETS